MTAALETDACEFDDLPTKPDARTFSLEMSVFRCELYELQLALRALQGALIKNDLTRVVFATTNLSSRWHEAIERLRRMCKCVPNVGAEANTAVVAMQWSHRLVCELIERATCVTELTALPWLQEVVSRILVKIGESDAELRVLNLGIDVGSSGSSDLPPTTQTSRTSRRRRAPS